MGCKVQSVVGARREATINNKRICVNGQMQQCEGLWLFSGVRDWGSVNLHNRGRERGLIQFFTFSVQSALIWLFDTENGKISIVWTVTRLEPRVIPISGEKSCVGTDLVQNPKILPTSHTSNFITVRCKNLWCAVSLCPPLAASRRCTLHFD